MSQTEIHKGNLIPVKDITTHQEFIDFVHENKLMPWWERSIEEYLEKEILPLKRKVDNQHGQSWDWVSDTAIISQVEHLRLVTFGDIKNQVGIEFKLHSNGESIFEICRHTNNGKYEVVNISMATIYPQSAFSDDTQVEVLNET